MGLPGKMLVAGFLGAGFAVALNMLALVMIGKINEKVPEGERVGYFGWSSGIKKRYRLLYPDSKLIVAVRICEVLMIVCFIVVIWFVMNL
jgi:hypothetical protein